MKKLNPVIKVKTFATKHSIKISEKTLEKKAAADNFLTDLADDSEVCFRWVHGMA